MKPKNVNYGTLQSRIQKKKNENNNNNYLLPLSYNPPTPKTNVVVCTTFDMTFLTDLHDNRHNVWLTMITTIYFLSVFLFPSLTYVVCMFMLLTFVVLVFSFFIIWWVCVCVLGEYVVYVCFCCIIWWVCASVLSYGVCVFLSLSFGMFLISFYKRCLSVSDFKHMVCVFFCFEHMMCVRVIVVCSWIFFLNKSVNQSINQ